MSDQKINLMICGNGRHGKDTLCDILAGYGYTHQSSSQAAAAIVFYEIKDKYGYKSVQECFEDRANHRKEWFDIISENNRENPTALTAAIYAHSNIYCGIRRLVEFNKAKEEGYFDLSIWVDACERLPEESPESNEIRKEHCDIVIYNNGTLEEFETRVHTLLRKFI